MRAGICRIRRLFAGICFLSMVIATSAQAAPEGASDLAKNVVEAVQAAAVHVHQYDHCLCDCGDICFEDTDDQCVVLTDQDMDQIYDTGTYAEIPEQVWRDGVSYTVVGLGPSLFRNRTDLESVQLPDTLRYIGRWCFDGCSNLKTISLPDSVEVIELAAFQLCSSLKEIRLPESLRKLGNFAYNHCSGAENMVIHIPASLTQIGEDPQAPAHMFYNCGKAGQFTAFDVDPANPAYKSENGILYTKDGSTLVAIPCGKTFSDGVYTLPDSVTVLGELSFSRNRNVTTLVLSDRLVPDPWQTIAQRAAYLNRGNDLAVACYGYSGVSRYGVKKTNPNYQAIDGILYDIHRIRLVAIPMQYEGEIRIPEGVRCWSEGALSTDVDYFQDLALHRITAIRLPSTLQYIEDAQMEAMNRLSDLYGTVLTVADGNPVLGIDENGHLCRK